MSLLGTFLKGRTDFNFEKEQIPRSFNEVQNIGLHRVAFAWVVGSSLTSGVAETVGHDLPCGHHDRLRLV